eukprot:Phypoly_transcript_25477.p2 GENE.Phypoly_transcript_25477~~Phypoly_transcript_25477.p2  ORF type:complete len:113 (+),score=45.45 Phypoly_transcript_25477:150-488(+)
MPADFHTDELAASYAALILHDDNQPIKSESIAALCKAAGVNVQPHWAKLYQQVFAKRSVGDFLVAGVSAAPAAAAPAAAGAAKGAAPAKEEKKVVEEKKEESDDDMGFGLFD